MRAERYRETAAAVNLFVADATSRSLRAAVRDAVAAYNKTGRMLDAALAYARHGFPVVPCTRKTKVPIARRDPDPTGKFPDGIPGTGGFKKATTDPERIKKWWRRRNWLIGIPTGERSGFIVVDIDTGGKEHSHDGRPGWAKLLSEHEPFTTRQHRSASAGPHYIFNNDPQHPLGCSSGKLPKGIDVKGNGGFVIVPPSVRQDGRAYSVFANIDPINVPRWLLDLIGTNNKQHAFGNQPPAELDQDKFSSAMAFLPNPPDLDTWGWLIIGLAIFAATGGSDYGLTLFDEWSRKWPGYDPVATDDAWQRFAGSPPSRTGAEKIYKMAEDLGWVWQVKPSYPAKQKRHSTADDIEKARAELRRIVDDFLMFSVRLPLDEQIGPKLRNLLDYVQGLHKTHGVRMWPTLALNAELGVGKTLIAIEAIAAWLRRFPDGVDPIGYAVPTHQLANDVAARMHAQGIDARVFRGRDANNPQQPGSKMCLNYKVVEEVIKFQADINTTCCKYKERQCAFYTQCGYQWQQHKDRGRPQVWIFASDMLFHEQKALKGLSGLFIDESYWTKGLRGVDKELRDDDVQQRRRLPIAMLIGKITDINAADNVAYQRHHLGKLLADLEDGPIRNEVLSKNYNTKEVEQIIKDEWRHLEELPLRPGMTLRQIARFSKELEEYSDSRKSITIWQEIKNIIDEDSKIEISGRLLIKHDEGHQHIYLRGIGWVTAQFQIPTMIMDATLPDVSAIIHNYHPLAKLAGKIDVEMPTCVRVTQIRKAPTTASKLLGTDNSCEVHRHEVRRYILQRWLELGKCETLVICQERFELWLKKQRWLPDNIKIEHYNNIAGLDSYKNVRLHICVGRTQPGSEACEAQAGALSGAMPEPGPGGFWGFKRIDRGVRLRGGKTAHGLTGDRHPDALSEGIRYQQCEAGLLQAIGRSRGINRTEQTPLDIDLLFDTVLDLTVDRLVKWQRPSLLIETAAADGVMLTSLADLMKAWPKLWPNETLALRIVKAGIPDLPRFTALTYQPAGARVKPRTGYFDLDRVADPRAWLESRLGRSVTLL